MLCERFARSDSFEVFDFARPQSAMIDKAKWREPLAMDTAAWPYGRGEMAERIRTFDWASTPLGPILSWPQSLKTAVEVMLESGFPASMLWGQEAILLYNDANARILGSLHPAALGRPVFEGLPARRHQPFPDNAVHHAFQVGTPRRLRRSAMVLEELRETG